MSTNSEIVNRNQIMSGSGQDFGFDKVLRGYDTKQVDEYILNLLNSNKNVSENFDRRLSEFKNKNEMLEYELAQTKGELEKVNSIIDSVRQQRDDLKSQIDKSASKVNVNADELATLQEKVDSLTSKNRLLAQENKNLEDKNRDLQRDVAHLTKKVDKNRFEIKDLQEQLENGMTSDTEKKNSEVAKIYESAIDKAEDLIYRLQTELSLAHSKAEDVKKEY